MTSRREVSPRRSALVRSSLIALAAGESGTLTKTPVGLACPRVRGAGEEPGRSEHVAASAGNAYLGGRLRPASPSMDPTRCPRGGRAARSERPACVPLGSRICTPALTSSTLRRRRNARRDDYAINRRSETASKSHSVATLWRRAQPARRTPRPCGRLVAARDAIAALGSVSLPRGNGAAARGALA